MEQLPLRLAGSDGRPQSEESRVTLGRFLASELGRPVRLVVTNNRSTMLSYREEGRLLRLRLHRMFLAAPPLVHAALVAYLASEDPKAGRLLDAFVASAPHSPPPARTLRPRGRCHDLQEIWRELNARFFAGGSRAQVTWGSAGSRRRRRSIQLGCYLPQDRLIRIHPSLDQEFVPRSYVAWIVFHEMLHEVFGVAAGGGRHSVHPPELVAIEETFPEYQLCKAWEAANIARLLRYRGG